MGGLRAPRSSRREEPLAKLLVSDDDPHVLEYVTLVLEGAGHHVVTTSDAQDVLRLATESPVDAIILDVNMPISGYEVLNRLRNDEVTAHLPILFLSGMGEDQDRVRGLREGADDYLVKPFVPDELVLRVERLITWNERGGIAPRRNPALLADFDDPPPPRDGKRRFGRYEVIEVIGQGSMGTVYLGRDPRLERLVALKTIRLEAASSQLQRDEMLDRLRREAVTIARFSQPNIIAVYDMGDAQDSAFIAMELVDGLSLRDLIKSQGPLAPGDLVPMAAAVARGLAAAHDREVIHRDVKPGNVLLGRDGGIKVSDFGLAFVVSSMSSDSTEISGTPGYVPPEVMNQNPYTESGDLFGFGATLYESLTGIHPLAGPTLRDTIMNTLQGKIRPLAELCQDLPKILQTIITRLLSTDPAERPSAKESAEILEQFATEHRLRWSSELIPEPTDPKV